MIPKALQDQIDQQIKETQSQAILSASLPPAERPAGTFMLFGHEWTRHKPGDPPPSIIGRRKIHALWRCEEDESEEIDTPATEVENWEWDEKENSAEEITAWRFDEPAAVEAKLPDLSSYGEPWKIDLSSDTTPITRATGGAVLDNCEISDADLVRIGLCVNECAGIPDPAAAFQEARMALAFYATCAITGTLHLAGGETAEKALNLITPQHLITPKP